MISFQYTTQHQILPDGTIRPCVPRHSSDRGDGTLLVLIRNSPCNERPFISAHKFRVKSQGPTAANGGCLHTYEVTSSSSFTGDQLEISKMMLKGLSCYCTPYVNSPQNALDRAIQKAALLCGNAREFIRDRDDSLENMKFETIPVFVQAADAVEKAWVLQQANDGKIPLPEETEGEFFDEAEHVARAEATTESIENDITLNLTFEVPLQTHQTPVCEDFFDVRNFYFFSPVDPTSGQFSIQSKSLLIEDEVEQNNVTKTCTHKITIYESQKLVEYDTKRIKLILEALTKYPKGKVGNLTFTVKETALAELAESFLAVEQATNLINMKETSLASIPQIGCFATKLEETLTLFDAS